MPKFLVAFKGGPWDGVTVDRDSVQLQGLQFNEGSSIFWVASPGVIVDDVEAGSKKGYGQHGYHLIDHADFGDAALLRCRYFGSR